MTNNTLRIKTPGALQNRGIAIPFICESFRSLLAENPQDYSVQHLRTGQVGQNLSALMRTSFYGHLFRAFVPSFCSSVNDGYRNFLANPPIEGLLVFKAIRTFEFAA